MSGVEDRADSIRMIHDSAAAVVAPGDLKRVRALRFAEPGFDRGVWRRMAGMGWLGLRVPEADGGAGLGMGAFCALAEELGAGLVPEPLISAAISAAVLRGPALAMLLSGQRIVLPAWQEAANSLAPGTETRFRAGQLSGGKVFVPMAAGADAFLVAAREGLCLVQRDAPGVSLAITRTQDGGHYGTLTFIDAPADAVAGRIEPALDEAALATAAYLLGVMRAAFAMTLDFLKMRKQFGRTIGSFQALQHRAADLKIQLELTRASVESAASVLDSGAGEAARQAAVSRAKARAAEAALLVTRQAIQLHGGIAYTDEYDVGLFLRKTMVLANLYGSAALHRARFAATAPQEES